MESKYGKFEAAPLLVALLNLSRLNRPKPLGNHDYCVVCERWVLNRACQESHPDDWLLYFSKSELDVLVNRINAQIKENWIEKKYLYRPESLRERRLIENVLLRYGEENRTIFIFSALAKASSKEVNAMAIFLLTRPLGKNSEFCLTCKAWTQNWDCMKSHPEDDSQYYSSRQIAKIAADVFYFKRAPNTFPWNEEKIEAHRELISHIVAEYEKNPLYDYDDE